jgi:phosphoglycerate dehydrogenase-like enzyme
LNFPPAARKVKTLNELLAASDVVSLHCSLTAETVQIINVDALQHIKPGDLFHFPFCWHWWVTFS